MSTAGTASSAATQPVRSIALSLTEDYCPSWGAWEGVRELVQNFHDGCLDSGASLVWHCSGDGTLFRAVAGGRSVGMITYDADAQRLMLTNRNVALERRFLLLGSSRKADSSLAIGQFGEGMKVGTLALLREGRRVSMRTRDEHWQWTRKLDEAFGVRCLTVDIFPRASQVFIEEDASLPEGEEEEEGEVEEEEDTTIVIEPISSGEWRQFRERFLFLCPPSDSFACTELGELPLDPKIDTTCLDLA